MNTTLRSSEATRQPLPKGPLLWSGAIWLAFALVDAIETVMVMHAEGMHHPWGRLFTFHLLLWLVWALGTPWVLALDRRWPLQQRRWRVPTLAHAGLCALIAIVASAWTVWLRNAMDPLGTGAVPGTFADRWFEQFFDSLLGCIVIYATLLAIGYGLRARERLMAQQAHAARLSELLAKAELDALRRQLEPHFLFNALNAIAGLVRERRHDQAIATIVGVSDLLRRVIDKSASAEVSLREELDFLRIYFDIQKLRFGDRLDVGIEVPDHLLATRVPRLILQPLAENACKHGVGKRAQGGAIRISAAQHDEMLAVRVYNDGPVVAQTDLLRPGVGLSNTLERLRNLYGERCDLRLESRDGGTEVFVVVPLALA